MSVLMNKKAGFSLIELMVVIVIVIILALALTPLFREEIEKARYSEGISALGALNTKVKLYIAENNKLPPASTDNYAKNVVRLVNSDADSFGFRNDGGDSADALAKSPFQSALGIGYSEYEGRYFKHDHYQYCMVQDGLSIDGSYAYGLAVVGGPGSGGAGADDSKASVGTYYAIFVRQAVPGGTLTPAFVTATKAEYSPTDIGQRRLADSAGSGFILGTGLALISLPDISDNGTALTDAGWSF